MQPGFCVFACGGTIDKVYGTGAGVRDLEIGDPYAFEIFRRSGGSGTQWCSESLFKKDSLDMDDEDRLRVAQACKDALVPRIIVTHGTDTMHKTAKVLAEWNLERGQCIILTGSLQPGRMKDSDADFNLGIAFGAVFSKPNGIWIAMHGIHRWDQCEKDPTTGRFVPL